MLFPNVIEAVRTGTTDPFTFGSGTGGLNDRAVVVSAVHGSDSTDYVVGVTVNGLTMTRIVRATDTAGEAGAAELWFWTSATPLPSASVTVSVDLSSATTVDFQFVCWRISAAAQCEVIDFDSLSEDAANPTRTLSKGGREALCIAAMYGGAAAPGGTLAADNTLGPTEDLGNFYAQTCYETAGITGPGGTTDFTIGWSTLASDDLAFVCLAVAEVAAAADQYPRLPRTTLQAVNRAASF
jgi:hypothetical protein